MTRPAALVVDDDVDLGELISRVLTSVGYQVSTATQASAAVRQIRDGAPALVTLDLTLPGVTGTELLRELREASDAHLLVVTGQVLSEDELAELRRAGADGVLIKPFALRDLRELAADLLSSLGRPVAT